MVEDRLRRLESLGKITGLEVLNTPFFHGRAAYLVGRLNTGESPVPLVLALRHGSRGMWVDAVLTDAEDVSILFTIGIYLALLASVTLTDLPLMALIALIGLPVALNAFEPHKQDRLSADDCIVLSGNALMSSSLAGLLFCAALIIDMTL